MSKRARFETDKGLVTLSRGILTVREGETGSVKEHTVRGFEFNEDTRSLFVDVTSSKDDLHFKVTKTPREIRGEMLAAFVPKEHSRLKNLGDEESLAAFEKRHGLSEKKSKK